MTDPSPTPLTDLLDAISDGKPPPEVCPNCYHGHALGAALKANPASPTCSCVHEFHGGGRCA